MARARSIKPGFFKNEQLGELSFSARLLFAGLWTLADREGRLEDRPKRIKAEVFPYDEKVNIEKCIAELTDSGFVLRYEVNGGSYLCIPTWHKHQNPHHMEVPSVIPPPHGAVNKFNHSPITKQLREAVFDRDGRRCVLCSETSKLSIDHIIPVSKGGTSAMDNLRTLCSRCNFKRGNRDDESITGRERVEYLQSNPADSLNPVTLTLNLTPDCGSPAPATRQKRRSAEPTTTTTEDPSVLICDAVAAYTSRPSIDFATGLMTRCSEADESITVPLLVLAIHAVVREKYKITTPGFFMEAVPELIADEKDWKLFKSFPEHGNTPENLADARAYLRDTAAPERLRRFLNAWLASVQSEGAAA